MYESLLLLDPIKINFSASGMHVINIILAFIMFGVALGIKPEQFSMLIKNPKSALIGVVSQTVLLPLVTFIFVILFSKHLSPMVAMGMILVSACPGGNVSNFMSSLSKANVELSVSLTAVSTMLSTIMTPFNFAFYGGLYVTYISSHAQGVLQPLEIDNMQMFQTVFLLLGVPLVLGVLFSKVFPKVTRKIVKPIQTISIIFFLAMIVMAFSNNFDLFLKHIFWIFLIVMAHNALALYTGYGISTLFKLPRIDRRTITIETGIQNSGLGLVLLFNPKIFPPELAIGGMLFVTAWWGIWHIVSGLSISYLWNKRKIH